MADVRHDSATGQHYIYDPSLGEWNEATLEEAQAATRGLVENTARAVGDNLVDLVGIAANISDPNRALLDRYSDNPANDSWGGRLDRSNDAAQAGRMSQAPLAEVGAMFLDPTSLIGGGAIVKGAGAVAKATNIGTKMKSGVDNVIAAARGRADDSVGAARNTTQRTAGKSDLLTADAADATAMPLSGPQRAYLKAWESGDELAIQAAEKALGNADLIAKTKIPFAGQTAGDLGFGAKDQAHWFTRETLDALGQHEVTRVTKANLSEIRGDIQKVFKETLDEGNFPVMRTFDEAGEQVDVLKQLRDMASVSPKEAQANAIVKQVERAATKGDSVLPGSLDPGEMLEARKILADKSAAAFKAGQHETGQSFSAMGEVLEDAIEAALPELQQAQIKLARQRWKILKVLDRTGGTVSVTEAGMVNPGQFRRNWRAMTPSYKNAKRELTDFEKGMETVATLSADRANAGTTLVRGATAAAPGAAIVGGSALLGNTLFGN